MTAQQPATGKVLRLERWFTLPLCDPLLQANQITLQEVITMIREPEDKKILVNAPYQMFEESGLLVDKDEAWMGVVEEQYNRIKASYDSGKFKQMNDDESLSDICELFA